MDRLSEFVGSDARARLLAHFAVHPERRQHVRALQRHTGLGKRSLQTELERFQAMGLLRRQPEGRRVTFVRDPSNPQWKALDALVGALAPGLVLRDVLSEVPGIEAAFAFGSMARGDARDDSDIDILLYGDHIDTQALSDALLDAALVVDRRIDAKRFDRRRFVEAARPGASFLPAALAGPQYWLAGVPSALPV